MSIQKQPAQWTNEALDDIYRLLEPLKEKNPQASEKAGTAIIEKAKMLESHPRMGKAMSDGSGWREAFAKFGKSAYVLRYMVESDDAVIILRVFHSLENREAEQ